MGTPAKLLLAVALSLLGFTDGQHWKDLQKRAIVSEKASAIAASKVEYYKKRRDLKNAMKWMNREKKYYTKSQKSIEAAADAHPVPNKETATAQVTAVVSSAVAKEMAKLAKLASTQEEKNADQLIARMEARNAAGARGQVHAVMQYYKNLPSMQRKENNLRNQYTKEKAAREVAVQAANKDLNKYYALANTHGGKVSQERMGVAADKSAEAAKAVATYDENLQRIANAEQAGSKTLVKDESILSKTAVGSLRGQATQAKDTAENWEMAGSQHAAYEKAMYKVNEHNYKQVANLAHTVVSKETASQRTQEKAKFKAFMKRSANSALDPNALSMPGGGADEDNLGNGANNQPSEDSYSGSSGQSSSQSDSAGVSSGVAAKGTGSNGSVVMYGGAIALGAVLALTLGAKQGGPSQTGYARVASMQPDQELS